MGRNFSRKNKSRQGGNKSGRPAFCQDHGEGYTRQQGENTVETTFHEALVQIMALLNDEEPMNS